MLKSVNTKQEFYKRLRKEPNNKRPELEYKTYNNKLIRLKQKSKKETITLFDGISTANEFNKNFSELGRKCAEKIGTPISFKENIPRSNETMFLKATTESEVLEAINKLKSKKSPGKDSMRAETLQKINDFIAPPCHLLNKCFGDEHFPKSLKISLIKLFVKKRDKATMDIYLMSHFTNFSSIKNS